MSRAISMDSVANACLDGIEYSFEEYKDWSGGWWLWKAPEYLLTVNIAKELWKLEGSKYITLEDNIKETLKNANATFKGRPSGFMRQNGRADIVLHWGDNTPRAIIEVKHRVYKFGSFDGDIDRIIEMLKKESNLQFGISAFYIDNNYVGDIESKMNNRIETLYKQANDYIREYAPRLETLLFYRVHPADDGENIWASVVILIKQ